MRHRRAQGILWMAMAALGLTGVGQAHQGHFENPHPVPGLDSRYRDWSPFPSADGLTMYFGSDRQLRIPMIPSTTSSWCWKATSATRPSRGTV